MRRSDHGSGRSRSRFKPHLSGILSDYVSNDDKTFFMVMIESVEPEQSFFQTFWTYGSHVGKAIERVLWTNEMLNTVELIAGFLESHWNDTVANGHVALTVYSAVGQTNLSIDTHKTIKVLTKSAKIQHRMAAALRRLEFEELSKFHSLEYGVYHYHYRPARSKSRKRLIAALKTHGFSLWREHIVEPDGE